MLSKPRSLSGNGDCVAKADPLRWPCLVFLALLSWQSAVVADEPAPTVVLDHEQVTESSGLSCSHRRPDRLWTHNDSGDEARIFAFDQQGKATGQYRLAGVQADDWEDIASFVIDGKPKLLIADVGDNQRKRDHLVLYLVDEPDPDDSETITEYEALAFAFPEGPRDCEAVAVDMRSRRILLATKEILPSARIYALPLPQTGTAWTKQAADGAKMPPAVTQAEFLFRLPMPMVTAMDISTDGQKLLLCGYFDLFVYRRSATAREWDAILETDPQHYRLPALPQIEAACFDPDGELWVASEGRPGKLVHLPKITEP